MRIAIIYLGRRGAGGPLSYQLATHLTSQEQVMAMISTQLEGLALWRKSGIELITTSTYRSTVGAVSAWLNPLHLHRLASRIRAWGPDVLLYPMFYTLNPFLQQHLRNIPSVVAVHDPQPHPGLKNWAFHFLERKSIREATRCLIFSETFRNLLHQQGVPSDRIDCVPLPDFSYYDLFESAEPSTPPRQQDPIPTLLFFGRITAYKGLEILLQAYRKIRLGDSITPSRPARLLIVGDGDLRAYQPLLEGLPDIEIVNRWVGESEVATYFQRATLLVAPYTSASQSGVIAVAAGFGLPVLATDVGGLPEQIQDGVSGLLVRSNSVDDLACGIRTYLEDPTRMKWMGQNLRADFLANRNWDRIAGMVRQACQKAIQNFRPPEPDS